MINYVYRHYKNGKKYRILALGKHHESKEELITYRDEKGNSWVRPQEEFFGNVDFGGRNVARFKLVSKDSSFFLMIYTWLLRGITFSLGVLFTLSIIVAVFRATSLLSNHFRECTLRKVQDVNSCDLFGHCGVRFTDGGAGIVYLPVIDELTEVCK